MNELKTNTKQTRQRGTTLIELSVVIAVLLLLVGVLFIGITAWKNGANRAACIMNLSSIQKAVRGYENMNLLNAGDKLDVEFLTKAGFWQFTPRCPAGGKYDFMSNIPEEGRSYARCSIPRHVFHEEGGFRRSNGKPNQDNAPEPIEGNGPPPPPPPTGN
jgi:prepilin-type N-terminal cleavage/methylation domain-containing protein